MDQPPALAFTAFADAWPKAIETEIGAALCAIGRGKGLYIGKLKYRRTFIRDFMEYKLQGLDFLVA